MFNHRVLFSEKTNQYYIKYKGDFIKNKSLALLEKELFNKGIRYVVSNKAEKQFNKNHI